MGLGISSNIFVPASLIFDDGSLHLNLDLRNIRNLKAILRDSELLSEVNNAFCNSHPLLAQKVVTRSARAAVSKISADALLAKALSVR